MASCKNDLLYTLKSGIFFFSIGWCEYYSRNSCIRRCRYRYKPFLIFHSKNLIHEKYDKIPINITSWLIQSTCAGADVIIEHLDNVFCGIIRSHRALMIFISLPDFQHAKKVVSDSLGQVDFSMRLMNSVLNLPNRQITNIINPTNQKFFLDYLKWLLG